MESQLKIHDTFNFKGNVYIPMDLLRLDSRFADSLIDLCQSNYRQQDIKAGPDDQCAQDVE
jgi:hypothetical protein